MSLNDIHDTSSNDGVSTATLDPVDAFPDTGLLDHLAAELNEAQLSSESQDDLCMQELESRLADREKLVGILTERLEQAADELDRVKRSGGVIGRDGSSADVAGLLEEHRDVATKLDSFMAAWEERYEGPSLRRIEAGMEELRERLEQMGTLPHSAASAGGSAPASLLDTLKRSETDDCADDVHNDECERSDVGEISDSRVTNTYYGDPVRLVLISDEEIPDDLDVTLPVPVDEEDAPETLRQAVTDRDQYIGWLCSRVRDIASHLEFWLVGLRTESDDDSLQHRIDGIEQLIHDQLRVAEVELSIERAKLSRQQAKLKQETEELDRDREQLARLLRQERIEEETPLLRRWKKFIVPQDE